MIVRSWRGRAASPAGADSYARHLARDVLPRLKALPGYRGAQLLRRDRPGSIELVVLTSWDSLDAVRDFAGDAYEVAVVEPEARSLLASFDEHVEHFQAVELDVTAAG